MSKQILVACGAVASWHWFRWRRAPITVGRPVRSGHGNDRDGRGQPLRLAGPHATMKINADGHVWDITLAPPARNQFGRC
jgi:hypothetical protein